MKINSETGLSEGENPMKKFNHRAGIALAFAILQGIVNPVTAGESISTKANCNLLTAGELTSTKMKPGTTFREQISSCEVGPEMVVLPSGSFRMGCLSGSEDCYNNEKPVHSVQFEDPFAVSVYEVTFEDYDRFIKSRRNGETDGETDGEADDEGWGRGHRPVINVSWDDAKAYVAWLSKETQAEYRLLSESEWEYAARAGSSTKYSWGDEIGVDRANCYQEYCGDGYSYTAPVGSFMKNKFGLYDMHGNVYEWVEDCWPARYDSAHRVGDGLAQRRGDCEDHVLRGGSWGSEPRNLRSADRDWNTADSRSNINGFRVARTLKEQQTEEPPLRELQQEHR